MKRFLSISLAAGLLAATSVAGASSGQLAQVTVHGDSFSTADCTPPNPSKECADFHAAIRCNSGLPRAREQRIGVDVWNPGGDCFSG